MAATLTEPWREIGQSDSITSRWKRQRIGQPPWLDRPFSGYLVRQDSYAESDSIRLRSRAKALMKTAAMDAEMIDEGSGTEADEATVIERALRDPSPRVPYGRS